MLRYLALLTIALLATGCATQAATSGRFVIQDPNARVAVSINERDRGLIDDYYGKRRRNLPPGLAKRHGNLPPGLAKRDTLPPGLDSEALPVDLERQLSPLPAGYVRMRVGADVVLLDGRTRVVIDVVYGVAI
jgi:hypothetical protein